MNLKLSVSIREFVFPQDYSTIIALWENAGDGIHVRRSDEPAEIQKKLQRDPDLFLLAEYQGEVIGSVLGGFDGRRGMMYHLAVTPEHRERGVATLLVEELERRLRLKGCIRYYLMVTKANLTAIQYYEKRGWELMDLYTYAKDL
ncbi:MAG: GNAT family N-acetyltransferase [Anaerolineae bacterium]|nr:GNAT family N-acetyltransferase [Anaerolineae bacterium]MCZ7552924.1 GNAT family N-acetyltransferase [Anaerolineales bacterium]